MKQSTGKSWLLLVLLLFALFVVGCSSTPPPCNVAPEQVEQAKIDLDSAEARAAAAGEAEALQAEIDALKGKTLNAQELADLREHLEELKLGSGR